MTKNNVAGLFRFLVPLLACALLTSCAGYRVGSMLPEDIKSVYVPTVVNKTREPLIEVDVTRALIQELQRDGSLQVVSSEDAADAVLDVTLVDYALDSVAYRSDRRTTTREYRLTLTSTVHLRRVSDATVVVNNPRVQGDFVFEVFGDLSSSKLRGLKPAAEDLAHDIVETVVEVW